jgi:hypothetical protein
MQARSLIRAATLAAAALVALPGSALAGKAAAQPGCTGSLSQPFKPWGDSAYYTLTPGGDFETALSGWTLTGGAVVTSGSETFAATGALGAKSLSVPVGSTALSAPVCVDPTRETFRFFARSNSTAVASMLKVEILYPRKNGSKGTMLGGLLSTANVAGWQVSPIYSNSTNLALLSGLTNPPIQYRFTAINGGWQVDDIFVDPRMR